jgi:hypothetical protein
VTSEQARSYDEKGYFILENAFSPETVAEVTSEIDPVEEKVEGLLRKQKDGTLFIAKAGAITFSRRPRCSASSPGIRTTATPTSSLNATSPAGWP